MTTSQNSRVLTLVFTDLAGSTALKAQRGDAAADELIARHREHVTRLAAEGEGSVISWAGDGCFLTFETASAAVVFSLRLQQIHKYEADLPGVRAGIHMGEVSVRSGEGGRQVDGLIVDLTARISGLARAGQVLISAPVNQSAKQRLGIYEFGQPIRWENYGPYTLKGFDEPVEIREAGLENVSPFLAPEASEKAWPAQAERAIDGKRVIRKIAVLPFTNISDNSEQEWFVDGMTEILIAELAKIKALTVISRTSAMHYKKSTKPLPDIARELGVDALVEGAVMRAGDRLRITAQLIDAGSDAHLWAERYDGTMEEVLDLQSNVALAIAKEVNVALTPEEAAPRKLSRLVNPAAFDLLMQARYKIHVDNIEGFNEAIQCVEEALTIDPEYADAYAWLAAIYAQHIAYGTVDHERAYFRARTAAQEAIRLGGESALALFALAQVTRTQEWDWDTALEYALRAEALDPSDSNIQSICGLTFTYGGNYAQAHRRFVRAIDTDPLNPLPYLGMGAQLLAERRYDDALRFVDDKIKQFPKLALLRSFYVLSYLMKGDRARAIEESRALAESGSDQTPDALGLAGACCALGGDVRAAEAYLAELRAHPRQDLVKSFDFAVILASLGRMEESYPYFERSYRDRDFILAWMTLVHFFELPPFKDDERIQRLIARIGIK